MYLIERAKKENYIYTEEESFLPEKKKRRIAAAISHLRREKNEGAGPLKRES